MLNALVHVVIAVGAFLVGGVSLIHNQPQPNLGASLPSGAAVFETSLQSRISSTDTSLTLVANNVRGGSSLSGYQCFTIDEGRTDAEYVCGSVSGTSVTSLERGIDPSTGTTTNSALKFAHRVGANVKITDFPLIQRLRSALNGSDTISNVIRYASGVTPTSGGDLTDYEFVTGLAFNGAGVIDATNAAKGVVEIATAAEAAASTLSGSSGRLALGADIASSTYNAATAANIIPLTGLTGILDPKFIFNGQSLTFPSTAGASSTVLSNNGSGGLTWNTYNFRLPATITSGSVTAANATTTIFQVVVPANSLSTANAVYVRIDGISASLISSETHKIEASFGGTSSTTISFSTIGNNTIFGSVDLYLYANGSTNAQKSALSFNFGTSTAAANGATLRVATSTSAVDSTTAQTLYIAAFTSNTNSPIHSFIGLAELMR